jgi:hypothetical protein
MRRRRTPREMPPGLGMPEPPERRRPDDPFLGQHFEDYLSPMAEKTVWPEQPFEAALNAKDPYGPDDESVQTEWYARAYGEEAAKRRVFLEHDEPGGKTFNFKKGEFR